MSQIVSNQLSKTNELLEEILAELKLEHSKDECEECHNYRVLAQPEESHCEKCTAKAQKHHQEEQRYQLQRRLFIEEEERRANAIVIKTKWQQFKDWISK